MKPNKRVLFVDDEAGVRSSWNRYLTEAGFEVGTAVDGRAAMQELQRNPAAVVVSDLRMPSVDGLELLEWTRDQRPDVRFILLTGYGNEEIERRARELGAFEYLNKPISPETLAAVITAALHLGLLGDADPEPREMEPAVQTAEESVLAAPRDEELALAKPTDEELALAVSSTEDEQPTLEVRPALRMRGLLEVVGGLIAAPLVGLAFVIFLPVIGIGMLFWLLGQMIWEAITPAES